MRRSPLMLRGPSPPRNHVESVMIRLARVRGLVRRALLIGALAPAAPVVQGDTPLTLTRRIDANRIDAVVTNTGWFAGTPTFGGTEIQYPRGSGAFTWAPMGLWVTAKVAGQPEAAVTEFLPEFRPGPMIGDTFAPFDPTYRVYKVSRSDT